MTPPMAGLFAKYPQSSDPCQLLSHVALRAWRRPPREDELDRLMQLYDLAREHGENHHAAVRHAMKAVLVSVSFLFNGELEPPARESQAAYSIGEYELAARLSFFLWSTMPDDELLDLAQRGQLR